jgi:CRISPR-associated protein (Cas_Cas5).
MPKFIKIKLRGHIMSFGGDMVSLKWRGTNDRPTMSFVIGFLCSCLGVSFRKSLKEVRLLRDKIKVHIIVVRKGQREIDFQTAGTNYDLDNDIENMCRVIKPGGGGTSDIYKKEILVDGKFDIIIEVEDTNSVNGLIEAIKKPMWMPFLGRKSNHISDIPFGGVYETLEEALEEYPKDKGIMCFEHVAQGSNGSEPVKDYPLCEGDNRTTLRYVKERIL